MPPRFPSPTTDTMPTATKQIDNLIELFLDFVNNYLTVDKFAEHHEITLKQAHQLLTVGKALHEARVAGDE